jgi:hypothetical protein
VAPWAQAVGKTIVLESRFGDVKSEQGVKTGLPNGVELGQKVRVDPIESADPAFHGATITLYEHSESFPADGRYRVWGVIDTRSGDKAFIEYSGTWTVETRDGKFAAAPFAAKGTILGGTGALSTLAGTVAQSGRVTPETGGIYRIELTTR